MTSYLALHDGWTVTADAPRYFGDRGVPATVPGCVHTDLLAAGLIPDPLRGDREPELAWIGETDWRYSTMFRHEGGERVDLVCAGLDTIADIDLNGRHVAST